jgi:hypothetical protein
MQGPEASPSRLELAQKIISLEVKFKCASQASVQERDKAWLYPELSSCSAYSRRAGDR